MANDAYKEYYKKHQLDFIKLTDLQEKELARLYIEAAGEIKLRAADIVNKKGLTAAQAKIRINSLLREAARLSDDFKNLLDKSLIETANLSTEVNKLIMGKYQAALKKEGINLNLGRILNKVSPEAVKAVYNRIWTDGLKLSDRIWLLDRRTKQEIERIVMSNIVSGGAASDKVTISALNNLLNPAYTPAKLTSLHGRKVGYEASRLLRTSTSEAFNEGDRMSNNANPGVHGEVWLTATGCCDLCDEKDGKDVTDVGYPPEHPNCRCTTLAKVESVSDFTDRFVKFMDNPDSDKQLQDWLVNVYNKGGVKTITAVKEAVKEVKTESKFVVAKTKKEAEEYLKNKLGLIDVKYGNLSIDNINKINEELIRLGSKYGSALSKIAPYGGSSMGITYGGQTVKFSSRYFSENKINVLTDVVNRSNKQNWASIPVTVENEINQVTIHEFAHTLIDSQIAPELKNEFMGAARIIRNDYRAEMFSYKTLGKQTMIENGKYISAYASAAKNFALDEFIAESFTQTELSNNPSPYAIMIKELINKYYLKK